ncbi:hypothetical protein [Bacillus cereus]|uniref:hypothetical protein n=1 Tax=Bacillus cereus TaxID=1396 RepID=UPI00234D9B66|nr:hypothetical protein [Bacillus cereus]MDC7726397.1 hypothetical protein [Bacillus cereus]
MSEEQQFQGDRWTTQTSNILTELGWIQKGDSNFDIPCSNKALHKTGENPRKNPHGIDLLFSYFDPHKKKDLTVVVESKHRKWNGINTSNIQDFVDQLLMTVDCATTNTQLKTLGCQNVRTGLLMIWCNEPELFDEQKFREYLKNLNLHPRKNPIPIYVASNTEILRMCSLINKVKEIDQNPDTESFSFFYPSDYFSGGQTPSLRKEHINLTYMFSKYIFAKSRIANRSRNGTTIDEVNHVFFFATPTLEELNFMYSCIKKFQFEDADKLLIHFYDEQTDYRVEIKEFLRAKQEELKRQKSYLVIETDYMTPLSKVPENYSL